FHLSLFFIAIFAASIACASNIKLPYNFNLKTSLFFLLIVFISIVTVLPENSDKKTELETFVNQHSLLHLFENNFKETKKIAYESFCTKRRIPKKHFRAFTKKEFFQLTGFPKLNMVKSIQDYNLIIYG